jgi:hypothetical protein
MISMQNIPNNRKEESGLPWHIIEQAIIKESE